jgi:hypothetical protein
MKKSSPSRAALAALLILATTALAACGGSSSAGTTTAAASGFGQRRAEIAACLQKYGVTLPQRPQGATGGPRPGGGLFGGGAGGATGGTGGSGFRGFLGNPQIRADLAKCGINLPQRGAFGGAARFQNPQFQQSVEKFVSCVRANGYNLPNPNFSGSGPVFSASQVNRSDPKFQAATAKCQQYLRFGGPPAGGTGGTPAPAT